MSNIDAIGSEVRPSHHPNNEISFLWKPGLLIAELVCQPDKGLVFAIREAGNTRYEDRVESFKPLSWLEPLVRAGVLKLPDKAELYGSIDELARTIRDFIHRYFDCAPEFESVATLYVLHTWLYELFGAVPYLRFLGIAGSGKTRGTQTIGGACYRPMVIGGTSSTASVFRQIEATGGTLLVDEADFNDSKIGSEIGRILNNGYQRGLPVMRTEKLGDDWVPRPYTVFGPKVINGRQRFRDDATESRCLVHSPHQTGRADIPRQLPATFHAEALDIRNQALTWRLEKLDVIQPQEILVPELRPRTNEIIMPLLVVAEQFHEPERQRYREELIAYAKGLDEESAQIGRDSVEAMLVNAYVVLCSKGRSRPTCGDVAAAVHGEDDSVRRWLNPRKVSELLRDLGFTTQHSKRGAEIDIDPQRLAVVCSRYGVSTALQPAMTK